MHGDGNELLHKENDKKKEKNGLIRRQLHAIAYRRLDSLVEEVDERKPICTTFWRGYRNHRGVLREAEAIGGIGG